MKIKWIFLIVLILVSYTGFSQSADKINKLKRKIEAPKHDTSQINLYRKIGKYYQSKQNDSALKYFQQGKKIAQKGFPSFEADIMSEIAKVHFYKGNYDLAIQTFNEALEVAEEINDKKIINSLKNNIGVIHFNLGNYDKALEYWKPVLDGYKELNDSAGMATLYANLGVIHYSRSNYIKALEYYMKSSEIREKIGDTKGIASINSKIGLIYNEQEEYFKAIQHLRKSYNLFKKLNDKRSMAKTLINIGNNYKSLDSAQKAINHYNRSLEISNEIKNRRLIAANLSNLGTEYLYRDKRDKAKEALQKALAINKQLGRKDNVASSLSNMGYFYYETGDIRKAVEYYKEVVKLENEIGTINESEQAYKMLSYCYAKLENYKKAWNYQNKHIAIKDTIFQKEKQEKMEEMKARYESKQKEKEIALLKKDKKLQRAKLKSNRTLRNFTILIASLILFFGIIYFIRFKKTVRLTRQLREKNKEVEKQKEEIALQSSNLKEINNLLKEKNKQIEDQRQYLEDLNNTKDRMFSIIAHDLKSPTATLKSTFELLLKKDINDQEKIHQIHTLLYDNVTSLYNLMDNLLMWAKNQQKEVSFNPELQNLTNLIENNIRVLKITADNKGVQIINNSNPDIMACFDKNMISTVIRNLISNAVKFTPSSGKVYVNTLESNNTIEVTIKDTGIGINKEDMEKILNTENHYSTNGTNKERGSGLGISICKRFIESHGSKLEVESAEGKGTTFRFKLPVNPSF